MTGVQVCSKVYSNAAGLHWHRRTQHLTVNDEVPLRFPCTDCGQTYASLRYLKVGWLSCAIFSDKFAAFSVYIIGNIRILIV